MITEQTLVAIAGRIAFIEMAKVVVNRAYEDCPHDKKCFEECGKMGKCLNKGILYWTWKILAQSN